MLHMQRLYMIDRMTILFLKLIDIRYEKFGLIVFRPNNQDKYRKTYIKKLIKMIVKIYFF